jgi:hypothetical protein
MRLPEPRSIAAYSATIWVLVGRLQSVWSVSPRRQRVFGLALAIQYAKPLAWIADLRASACRTTDLAKDVEAVKLIERETLW